MTKLTIELADCTNTLLREIQDKKSTRKDVARTYRLAILSSEDKDWLKINNAIVLKWSFSALTYIKNLAWSNKEI